MEDGIGQREDDKGRETGPNSNSVLKTSCKTSLGIISAH